jgi:hypothetical protein
MNITAEVIRFCIPTRRRATGMIQNRNQARRLASPIRGVKMASNQDNNLHTPARSPASSPRLPSADEYAQILKLAK